LIRVKSVKIGLLRHFKVKLGYPSKIVSSMELMEWQNNYDASDIEEIEVETLGVDWKRCYSSDLSRARITAEKTFIGEIIFSEDLREMKIYPIAGSKTRLPLWLHIFLIRVAWYFGHNSQKESKKQVLSRINQVLDEAIKHGEDVLIVGHGGIMMFMRKELLKRGFIGPKFNRPDNAKIYLFEKK
jgi:broad specificity phosphatase PhoE